MSLTRTLALSLLMGTAVPAAARADGLLVPFIGVNFGGNSGNQLSAAIDAERMNWGGSLAYTVVFTVVVGSADGERSLPFSRQAAPDAS